MKAFKGLASQVFGRVAKAGRAVVAFFKETKPAIKTDFQPTPQQQIAMAPTVGMRSPVLGPV